MLGKRRFRDAPRGTALPNPRWIIASSCQRTCVLLLFAALICPSISCSKQTDRPLPTDGAARRSSAREGRSATKQNGKSVPRRRASDRIRVARAHRQPATSAEEASANRHERPSDRGSGTGPTLTPSPHGVGPPCWPRPNIDESRVAAAGIRKLEGKHLVLYTDLAAGPEVDELPHVFDLAIAQWCEYFRVEPGKVESWKMIGYIMDRKERFQGTGLLAADSPPFLEGYQLGCELWVYEQPSAYYRRHLMLHEGTHAFMRWNLGGAGPPWYMEGMAELLATHRWENGQLQLNYFPKNRDEVSHWGRVKIVRTDVLAGKTFSIEQIAAYAANVYLRVEPYGWSWAAMAFLDGHPEFSARFRKLQSHVGDGPAEFRTVFERLFSADRRRLAEQWQLFVLNIDYGYDIRREAIVYQLDTNRLTRVATVAIQADRGWQSTGLHVEASVLYQLEASGRYQLARVPKIWWCEPGGVTIRYHDGRPLGVLLAAVSDPSAALSGLTPLASPEVIGLRREIEFSQSGTLYLRINEVPSELDDNSGQLQVRIERRD